MIRLLLTFLIVVLLAVAGFALWVRLAPSDPDLWHTDPRTERVAGAPGEGRITWVQRTRLWGFPDYITADAQPAPGGGTRLEILSRLRFGREDMGVNRTRVTRWLARLDAAMAL